MNVGNGYMKYGFDAYGKGTLKAEHMAYWMDNAQRTDPKGISFELGKDVLEVEEGFFDLVPTINELFILNPECNVIMSEDNVALFKKNNVLIRGRFDEAAESFAKRYGLRFLHSDVELAYNGDYNDADGIDIVYLRFKRDGSVFINQDNRCQGSSAGWGGGGEVSFNLAKKFYLSSSAESIANECWKSCREKIKSNGVLKELMEKAKIKGGFFIDYSKASDN